MKPFFLILSLFACISHADDLQSEIDQIKERLTKIERAVFSANYCITKVDGIVQAKVTDIWETGNGVIWHGKGEFPFSKNFDFQIIKEIPVEQAHKYGYVGYFKTTLLLIKIHTPAVPGLKESCKTEIVQKDQVIFY